VAVRDDGLAYFTQLFESGVGITSTLTRTIDGFIPTGFVPTGVAFSPDGGTVYVGNQDATVTVIDVVTQTPVATWGTEDTPVFAVQVSPEGDLLFAGGGSNMLYVFDTQTGEILNRVTVGHAPNAFAVAPDKPHPLRQQLCRRDGHRGGHVYPDRTADLRGGRHAAGRSAQPAGHPALRGQ
jgi:YVTN family beta-propeller protein